MATIGAFRVTQHSQIFHFSLEIEVNALRFINLQLSNSQALLNLRRGYYSQIFQSYL